MAFDHELILIDTVSSVNDIGDSITTEIRTTVLCDEISVTRSEHYSAHARGLRPEKVFVINKHEYSGQDDVEFEGRKYTVIRSFAPKIYKGIADFENLELVCQGAVNNGAS